MCMCALLCVCVCSLIHASVFVQRKWWWICRSELEHTQKQLSSNRDSDSQGMNDNSGAVEDEKGRELEQ